MDNIISTSLSQTSLHTDNPLNSELVSTLTAETAATSPIESTVSNPSEPVATIVESGEQTNIDVNVQPNIDVKVETDDVTLESIKDKDRQQNNNLATSEHHKIDMHDSDQHPDKSKSPCSMLNKSFLVLAIVCFALFFSSIIFFFTTREKGNRKDHRHMPFISTFSESLTDDSNPSERLINKPFFNLTQNKNGIIVVLSRRGASVHDILIPYKNQNESEHQYRSIVIKDENERYFGSVRFGFDDPKNPLNMTSKLPDSYQFSKLHKEDWSMYMDPNNPSRVRFVHNIIQIIYEISSKDSNEFSMKTIVTPPPAQAVVVDVTNNIYFNLRSYGNLSTHYLNLSLSNPINVTSGQKVEQDRLIHPQRIDKLSKLNSYFYTLDRAGIGKNYVATLSETETKTTMRVFSDHAGVGISLYYENDEINLSEVCGIRISPRQSPAYQPMSIYGQTKIVFPSEAIHTTWWQFDYEY